MRARHLWTAARRAQQTRVPDAAAPLACFAAGDPAATAAFALRSVPPVPSLLGIGRRAGGFGVGVRRGDGAGRGSFAAVHT